MRSSRYVGAPLVASFAIHRAGAATWTSVHSAYPRSSGKNDPLPRFSTNLGRHSRRMSFARQEGPGNSESSSKLFHPISSGHPVALAANALVGGKGNRTITPKTTGQVVAAAPAVAHAAVQRLRSSRGPQVRPRGLRPLRTPLPSCLPAGFHRRLVEKSFRSWHGEQLQNRSAPGRDACNRHVLRITAGMPRCCRQPVAARRVD